jgi:hypothetical protein
MSGLGLMLKVVPARLTGAWFIAILGKGIEEKHSKAFFKHQENRDGRLSIELSGSSTLQGVGSFCSYEAQQLTQPWDVCSRLLR